MSTSKLSINKTFLVSDYLHLLTLCKAVKDCNQFKEDCLQRFSSAGDKMEEIIEGLNEQANDVVRKMDFYPPNISIKLARLRAKSGGGEDLYVSVSVPCIMRDTAMRRDLITKIGLLLETSHPDHEFVALDEDGIFHARADGLGIKP
jgi:hypothetical protein